MYDKQLNNLSSDSLLCFLKRKEKKKEKKGAKKSNLRENEQTKKCKRSKSSYAINLLQAMVW